jgi:hypothetical protein
LQVANAQYQLSLPPFLGVSSAAGTGAVIIASGESLASEAGGVSVHAGAGVAAGALKSSVFSMITFVR